MGSEPLYLRVERSLASQISDGVWQPGDYLPSEQTLQQRYQVSRTTIRKAIGDLIVDGLLEIDRGNGTKVTAGRPIQAEANMMSFSATMRALGREPGVTGGHACVIEVTSDEAQTRRRLLERDSADRGLRDDPRELMAGAGSDEASEPGSSEHEPYLDAVDGSIPSGEGRLVHIRRVHTADNEPVSVSESWFPASVFAGVDLDSLAAQASLYAELSALDVGITQTSDRYGLAMASDREAELLGIAPGMPLLCIDRVGYTAQNRPIETSRIVVRPDRYRPTVTSRST
ncbi:GntR family transcriptional regulator [Propionimicrobium sp. PCR01-08-3]|uniref:GntR family transcriptional regulator n=1 Tax=Propionimicrobium sp. PCR01-08-3 TaxID=3052086 RepID=UPI00255CB8CF|nr:GntR family transcriptional regulator [Propionimicrobium sp. PCR01-08-3]WIY81456.1 GntR family transcriptional regulator [Propionimicrobium sp. PCR01-08-3]